MPNLTIVADIQADPNRIDLVKSELERLVPLTRAEEGCIRYDLHQDDENPAHFLFYETWETRELWQAHINSPHIKAYKAATEGAILELTLYEMTRVD